jgi:hypothetical protein
MQVRRAARARLTVVLFLAGLTILVAAGAWYKAHSIPHVEAVVP